ncbi:MAG TPA: class I SAM-dependent methyltransferase [Allosphingosinicella sp.]|nr:class I SAM-dependent methyltransferase [Allosphingosinicella sp.]
MAASNIDPATVRGFGEEWDAYPQTELGADEHRRMFESYFSIFPFGDIPQDAEGFDLGCGSGRWAALVLDRVGLLHCIDPSDKALAVAKRRLGSAPNARFHLSGVDEIPLADGSQDFGYSLGVLHHIPDTQAAMARCVAKLKPGAPFLIYLYYSFDNRPGWFRSLWKSSELFRRRISRLPFPVRKAVTTGIAATVYWPLARSAKLVEKAGLDPDVMPLSAYRNNSFYTMRTDSLDRFGTRLEQRFSRAEIRGMMERCGLKDIVFSGAVPYWVACGRKA